jgi:uncharacterized protein DUF1573
MKIQALRPVLILSIIGAGIAAQAAGQTPPPAPASAVATNATGPKIQFAALVYNFGRARSGELVKHVFTFTNTGDALLLVSGVATSCHCTTSGDWSRQVAPGQTGVIPVQLDSATLVGPVTRTVTVTSNDTNHPPVVLQVTGTVFKPIDVVPPFAVVNITSDSSGDAAATLRIVNNDEQPLRLSDPQSNNRAFVAELKTNQPGKEFELVVKTVPPLGLGNVQAQIAVRTSLSNMPVLNIQAVAIVQPPVVIMPPAIALPTAPLKTSQNYTVAIQNNSTNALVLSEPSVNAEGVDVQLKETRPGHFFTVTLNFPAGFEIAPGATVAFTARSSNPRVPVVKVPVTQVARPAVAQPVPLPLPPGKPEK